MDKEELKQLLKKHLELRVKKNDNDEVRISLYFEEEEIDHVVFWVG